MASLEAVIMAHQIWRDAGMSFAGGWPATDEDMLRRAQLWSAMLFDLDDEQLLQRATARVQSGERFAPSCGELIASGTVGEQDWETGWSLLLKRMNYYAPPEQHTDDTDLEQAIRAGIQALGGYRAACQMEVGDPAARAAFRDAFRRSIERSKKKRSEQRAALVGQVMAGQLTEQQARAEYAPTRPALRLVEGGGR